MAGLFPEEVLAQVRNHSDIVDVVSKYVTLKRKGSKFWGLCPFHNEKTPSFSVSPDKQFYYCFGCQAGGSVFHFIMNVEHLTFAESVEFLADRAGLSVSRTEDSAKHALKKKKKERLYEVNRLAARWFHAALIGEQGEAARKYLAGRGVDERTARHFGLGYAPDAWDALQGALTGQGCTEGELLDAGLTARTKGRAHDYFRDRVMFPILDAYGNVIAFGGRLMRDGQPKYLNSPDTEVFNKRRNLYGVADLKKLKAVDRAVLVEGYMDVIGLAAKGVTGAVASLGTAFTREQARLLKRYAKSVVVAYDGDAAGVNAALKALDVFEMEALPVRVARMPEGLDPDDVVGRYGREGFERTLREAQEPTDFRLDLIKAGMDLKVQKDRTTYAVEGAKVIARLDNPAEQAVYIARLQKETGFDADTLQRQVKTGEAVGQNVPVTENRLGNYRNNKTSESAERELLRCMVQSDECASLARQMLSPDDFSQQGNLEIARVLWYTPGGAAAALDALEDAELSAYAAQVFGQDGPADAESLARTARECCVRIRRQSIENKVRELQQQFSRPGAGREEQTEILRRIQELNAEFQNLQN